MHSKKNLILLTTLILSLNSLYSFGSSSGHANDSTPQGALDKFLRDGGDRHLDPQIIEEKALEWVDNNRHLTNSIDFNRDEFMRLVNNHIIENAIGIWEYEEGASWRDLNDHPIDQAPVDIDNRDAG